MSAKPEVAHERESEKTKENLEEKQAQVEVTETEKKKTADTARKLRQEGTAEAAAAVKRAMESAGSALDQKGQEQKREHDAIASEGKKAEGEVKKAAEATTGDKNELQAATREVKLERARSEIQNAAQEADKAIKFLERVHSDRVREREKSQEQTRKHFEEIMRTKVQVKS